MLGFVAKDTPGVSTQDELAQADPIEYHDFNDFSSLTFDFDAHFVVYRSREGHHTPRVNKVLLPTIREGDEDDLVTNLLVFDWDRPGHKRWEDKEEIDEALEDLKKASEYWPLGMAWDYFYTTKNGYRLIYRLDTDIPVDEAEEYHRWFTNELRSRDILVDEACSDWTRLFRHHSVIRDGEPTQDQFYFRVEHNDNAIPLKILNRIKVPKKASSAKSLGIPKPTPEEADSLLYLPNRNMTSYLKKVRKHLKHSEHWDRIFEHAPIATVDRNNELHRLTGYVTAMVYAYSEPQHVYALLREGAEQLTPDKQTKDWTNELWRCVDTCWTAEMRKEAEVEAQKEESEAKAATALAKAQEVMPEIEETGLLALHGRDIYVMGLDGRYSSMSVTAGNLVAFIRDRGLEDLMPLWGENKNGDVYPLKAQDLINKYGTVVNKTIAKPCIGGAYIANAGTDQAVLITEAFKRREIEGKYNPHIDTWLREFFGAYYAQCVEWLGHSLAFEDGPICALSINGPKGIGKTLLATGLSECIEGCPAPASGNDLIDNFNSTMRETGIIYLDEGLLKGIKKNIPDEIRKLIGNSKVAINRKNKAILEMHCNYRVVLTTNNVGAISKILGSGQLTESDRDAITQRILHINLNEKGGEYLRSKGGREYTKDWIESPKALLARHLLWLYENRKAPPGNRYLVEGHIDEEVLTASKLESPETVIVLEAILGLWKQKTRGMGPQQGYLNGLHKGDEELWVKRGAVLDYFNTNMRGEQTKMDLNLKKIDKSLENIGSISMRKRFGAQRARWTKVDLGILRDYADKLGYEVKGLTDED